MIVGALLVLDVQPVVVAELVKVAVNVGCRGVRVVVVITGGCGGMLVVIVITGP